MTDHGIARPCVDAPATSPAWWARAAGLPVLAPVLALACVMRSWGLGQAPLWMDETSTAAFAALPWPELLHGVGRMEPNPPAFYALEKLWIMLVGGSDIALRLPAVVFGLGGVAAVTLLAQASFGRRAALWTGLLLATQAQHLEHSREARVYVLLFLLVALAALAARRVAVGRQTDGLWRPAALLALCSGGAMLVHNTGPFAVVSVFVHGGVMVLWGPRPWVRRLAAFGAAGMGALIVAAPALLVAAAVAADPGNNAGWIPVPDWALAVQVTLAVYAVPLAGIRGLPAPLVLGGFLTAALIVGVVVVRAARHAPSRTDAVAMLAAVGAAVLTLYGVSQVVPIMIERTLLFSLVFFLPLLGVTLAGMPVWARGTMLAAMLAVQAPGLAKVYGPARHGQDWRGIAAELQHDVAQTGWPVVVVSGFEAIAIDRYLPVGDPARPSLSVTPNVGARLDAAMARLATSAAPIPQDSTGAGFCTALQSAGAGGRGGVLLVRFLSATSPAMTVALDRQLTEAGGTVAMSTERGAVTIQQWRGACVAAAAAIR